jgi:hypothetical protein
LAGLRDALNKQVKVGHEPLDLQDWQVDQHAGDFRRDLRTGDLRDELVNAAPNQVLVTRVDLSDGVENGHGLAVEFI